MLAAKVVAPYKIESVELPEPQVEPGKVLLENHYLGVCASDQQIYHGKHRCATFPLVMGHEVSARVAAVGEGVIDFKVGDRVVVQPQLVCGKCYPCSIGRFNVCEELRVIGVYTDGCACEYFQIDPWNLHKLPDNISYLDAALVEPLAVGMGAAHRAGELKGANVAVVGAGIIGNFTAQCCAALGAEKVIISDVIPHKLQVAEACGLVPVDAGRTSLKDAIDREFGSFRRADVIIDCAASRGSFAAVMEAARKSSKVIFTGNYKDVVEFDVPTIQRSEISLIGHMMYVKEDFTESIRCLSEGLIRTEGLITQHFPLSDYAKAFEYADANPAETIKMMIDIRA